MIGKHPARFRLNRFCVMDVAVGNIANARFESINDMLWRGALGLFVHILLILNFETWFTTAWAESVSPGSSPCAWQRLGHPKLAMMTLGRN